ncbi:hypothetical protein Tsubulata_031068, partial [Turnera subulata]
PLNSSWEHPRKIPVLHDHSKTNRVLQDPRTTRALQDLVTKYAPLLPSCKEISCKCMPLKCIDANPSFRQNRAVLLQQKLISILPNLPRRRLQRGLIWIYFSLAGCQALWNESLLQEDIILVIDFFG